MISKQEDVLAKTLAALAMAEATVAKQKKMLEAVEAERDGLRWWQRHNQAMLVRAGVNKDMTVSEGIAELAKRVGILEAERDRKNGSR